MKYTREDTFFSLILCAITGFMIAFGFYIGTVYQKNVCFQHDFKEKNDFSVKNKFLAPTQEIRIEYSEFLEDLTYHIDTGDSVETVCISYRNLYEYKRLANILKKNNNSTP